MSRRRRRGHPRVLRWLSLLALPLGARAGEGQSAFRASVDAGGALLRQTGQSPVTAPTVGGDVHLDGERAALRGALGATLAGSNRWSAQGDLTGSWFALARGPLATELGAAATALRYNGAPSATSGSLLARQHLRVGAGGAWVGAGGGLLARPGWNAPIGAAETGAWAQVARFRASLTLVAQRARLDTPVTDTTGKRRAGDPTQPPLTALDAIAVAEWRAPSWELGGSTSLRRAARQHHGVIGSAYVTSAWWVASRAAITASLGVLAADPFRALPGRRVATLGMRWRPAGPPAVPLGRPSRREATTPAAILVRRDGRAVLHVRAPGATRVEVRADCTAWRATALTPAGREWELDAPLPAGTQRLALRIDGGPWRPPANLPSVEDDFGEKVGLLVVP